MNWSFARISYYLAFMSSKKGEFFLYSLIHKSFLAWKLFILALLSIKEFKIVLSPIQLIWNSLFWFLLFFILYYYNNKFISFFTWIFRWFEYIFRSVKRKKESKWFCIVESFKTRRTFLGISLGNGNFLYLLKNVSKKIVIHS